MGGQRGDDAEAVEVISIHSDDDIQQVSDDDAVLLSDVLPTRSSDKTVQESDAQESERGARQLITQHATALASKGHSVSIPDSDDELESENDDVQSSSGEEDALRNVVRAATGRDLQAREERKAARHVQKGIGKEDPLTAPLAKERTGREVMDIMMSMLEKSADLSSNLGTLKSRIARLDENGKKPLDAPLPDVVAGRIERAAAYEKSTKELTEKWSTVVQQNRKEKTLKFPLNEPTRTVHNNTNNLVIGFRPQNELENEIQQILKQSGLCTEKDVAEREDETLKNMVSKEELLARRRELAKMRSLMFNYERKMKRISKIKSKKYRKILKTEREKLKREAGDESDEDEERIAAERRRAEERMSLRHKNTSKWVKRQLSRGETKRNPESRAAVEEQLRLHEELRRRQEGVIELSNSDNSDGDDDTPDISDDDDAADAQLEDIRQELEKDGERRNSKKRSKSGLMGMKFMQVAAERQRKEALELLNEMGTGDEDEDAGNPDEDLNDSQGKSGLLSGSERVGRRVFSGTVERKEKKAAKEGEDPEDRDADEHDSETECELLQQRVREEYERDEAEIVAQSEKPTSRQKESLGKVVREGNEASGAFTTALSGRLTAESDKSNPWVQQPVECGEEKPNVVEPISTRKDRSPKRQLEKPQQQTKESQKVAKGTSQKRVRFERASKRQANSKSYGSTANVDRDCSGTTSGATKAVVDEEDEDEPERNDISVRANTRKMITRNRERMEIVARAFAGAGGADEEDFMESKLKDIDEDVSSTVAKSTVKALPGWGSWDGAGAKKRRKRSAFAEAAIQRLEEARANAIGKRSDKDMADVHLSTRRCKQASELTLSSVPFPFRSAAEWEQEVSVPIVKEAITGKAYGNKISRKVETVRGRIIEPIQESKRSESIRTRKNEKSGKKYSSLKGVIDKRKQTAKNRVQQRRALLS